MPCTVLCIGYTAAADLLSLHAVVQVQPWHPQRLSEPSEQPPAQ